MHPSGRCVCVDGSVSVAHKHKCFATKFAVVVVVVIIIQMVLLRMMIMVGSGRFLFFFSDNIVWKIELRNTVQPFLSLYSCSCFYRIRSTYLFERLKVSVPFV